MHHFAQIVTQHPFQMPRAVVLNKLDRERASFSRSLESLQSGLGRTVTPIQLPIGEEKDFRGVVDLIRGKAYVYETDGSGNFKEEAIPDGLQSEAETRREQLIEMIAESDDELMEKFFEAGTLSDEELLRGLRKSVQSSSIFPVFCVSSTSNFGTKQLLDWRVELLPNPLERAVLPIVDLESKEQKDTQIQKDGPTAVFVFKTLADPFAGRINLAKVISGTLKSDVTLKNLNKDTDERVGTLQVMQGKTKTAVEPSSFWTG